jgi:hypothetical protein
MEVAMTKDVVLERIFVKMWKIDSSRRLKWSRRGVDMVAKCMLWVRARPDYEPLFSILDGLRRDSERRYWIERMVMEKNISDIQVDSGQMSTGVEILCKMSHKALTSSEEDIK